MKKVILTIALFFSVTALVSAQKSVGKENIIVDEKTESFIKWQTTFKDALMKSRLEKKPVLIYFTGSDWCGPCKTLDENLFHTEKFKKFSDEKLVLYMADFPRNADLVSPANKATNKELSTRYAQTSFPTMVMINEKGEVLGRKNGSYMIEYYYPFFEESLARNK